ncbi:hypothetical protein QD357_01920 [Rhizobium sp. BR 317]|uniref:hypothetical protein n=1 Tax=Rhizobium sp. BR 317 TaxID=3040015 RepID=UPI0039BFF579
MFAIPYQVLRIIEMAKPTWSQVDIREQGGPCERVQRRILNEDPEYRVKDEQSLMRILSSNGMLPWGDDWHFPISRLYDLLYAGKTSIVEHEFGAMADLAKIVLEQGAPTVDPAFKVGARFFSGLYEMAIASSTRSVHAKRKAIAAEAACHHFQCVIDELRHDASPGALLVKGKASGNIFVVIWNATPRNQRDGAEMRKREETSGYLQWALEQVNLFPKLDTAAFNALGVASRFRRRDLYPQLLDALVAANSKFEQYVQYQGDDDYDDFRSWLDEKRQESAAKTKKKRTLIMTNNISLNAIIAVVSGLALLAGVAVLGPKSSNETARLADLRPHALTGVDHSLVADLRPHASNKVV